MVEFEKTSAVDALEVALANAEHLALKHAATVAAARQVAARVDVLSESGWVDPSGKLDNVTVPTFLKYLDALGLVVAAEKAKPGPVSSASPAQQEANTLRSQVTQGALTLVPEVG